ncbi:hypothetical protein [Mycobacterium sp. P7213]|nr:hypothetical protein [Mycobacterium sp. P7213]
MPFIVGHGCPGEQEFADKLTHRDVVDFVSLIATKRVHANPPERRMS